MFHPERMRKVTIIGPQTQLDAVLKQLHKAKVLHILDHQRSKDLDIGRPLDRASSYRETLTILRTICSHFHIKQRGNPQNQQNGFDFENVQATVAKIHQEISEKSERSKAVSERLATLTRLLAELDVLASLPLKSEHYTDYKSLVYFVGFVSSLDFRTELPSITHSYKLFHGAHKRRMLIALFVDGRQQKEVSALLSKYKFSPAPIPKGFNGDIQSSISRLSKERRELQKELNHLDFSQKSLIHRYENFLVASQYSLEKEIEVAEAPLRLGATENFFWVTGWTPDRRVEEITSKVQAATSERVHITVENPGHNDLVPIRLDNPRMIRPFEFFLDLYSLPKYDEIDPTFFIFLSFPLFFGFMLGDIGYGIVTLALFLFLSKRYPQAGLIKALVLSSISSILFGAVFGEFFGEELYHFVSREHDMMFLFGNKVHAILVYALILGIIHINISLVIGFLNELRHHGFRHAFLAKISWIIVEAGAALLIAGLPALIGGIVMLIGVSLIVLGEGATGLIELPAIFSNVLSYARLMALGLASVALAAVINEFSFGFFHKGGISILFGVLILVAGHGINIGLGILGPFLHSLRLHYVEFFSRFYKGGGRPYIPFGT